MSGSERAGETRPLLGGEPAVTHVTTLGRAAAPPSSSSSPIPAPVSSVNNHASVTVKVPPTPGPQDRLYQSYQDDDSFDSGDSRHQQLLASDRSMLESPTSNMQTLMHLLKGNLGTGILALPKAFSFAGIWMGFGGMLFLGLVAVHCMHTLVECSHILGRRTGAVSLDYADVVEVALKTGPPYLRRFAQAGRNIVNGFLIFTQFGFCCVYIVFIAENVAEVVHHFHPSDPPLRVYEFVAMLLLLPYVCVRNLSMLAPFSAFANLLTISGMVIIFQYIVQDLPPVSSRPAVMFVESLPMFFGTAIFAVEGISLVLPLENNMKKPEEFGGFAGVLNLGMVTVVTLYTAIGFYGYLQFGDAAKGSITLNLPNDQWLYLSVNLMFAFSVYISYNIQFYVPINIIWPKTRKFFNSRSAHKKGEYAFRIGLVLVTFGIAAGIPHLDLLISLIGASSSTALALLIPAAVQLVTLAGEPHDKAEPPTSLTLDDDAAGVSRVPPLTVAKIAAIFVLGFLGWVTGTYTSLRAIAQAF